MSTPSDVRRSIEQNKKMWAMLGEIASQKKHPISNKRHPEEEWKILFMDELNSHDERKFLPSLDGQRCVPLADHRTSRLSAERMAELITCIQAWGDQHGVKFSNEQGLTWEAA